MSPLQPPRRKPGLALPAGHSLAVDGAASAWRRLRSVVSAGAAWLIVFGAAGCSSNDVVADELVGMAESDKNAVRIARTEQIQVGFRIDSAIDQDENGDLCHEMCGDARRSCLLSEELCSYGAKYPKVAGLHAKCRHARDLCRRHGEQVPRHCICER